MPYRKLLIIIAGISSLIFYSCKDYTTDVGAGLLKNNLIDVKTLDSQTDSLNQSSSFFQKTISLGSSSFLMVGNYKNVQGSLLLKYYFPGIPDTIASGILDNSITIKSASIELSPYTTVGDSNAAFDFTVHQIQNSWGTSFDADSLPSLLYNSVDMSSNRNIADSATIFDLDVSVISNWVTSYIDSNYSDIYGMYLKPTPDSKKFVEYQTYNTTTGGYSLMTVVFEKANTYVDTISFLPVQNVSVVNGTMPQIKSDEIAVQGGLVLNSKLWFDISKIPANSVINKATLTLNLDTSDSHYIDSLGNNFTLLKLKDSTANLIDSSSSLILSLSGNTISGDITPFVQNWIDNNSNQGLLIQDYNQTQGIQLYAIKGSNYPDLSARPRLNITYTTRK